MSRDNPPPYTESQAAPQATMAAPQVTVAPGPVIIQPTLGISIPVVMASSMGPKPATIVCKSCHAQITTRVEKKATTRTHIFAVVLCIFACWCCACIPYCMDSCNNADHYCPNCNSYIGSYIH